MPHRHNRYRRWLVILLIALLSPIMPGKVNLCLLPDGEIHLETECATPCSQAGPRAATREEGPAGVFPLHEDRGGCLDLSVGESAARHQIHNASQAASPGLLVLPRPVSFFPTGQLRSFAQPPAPTPHLKSHQTTVLRI